MAKFIQPKFFSEFKCDGSKCNSMCCRDWEIDIDEKTYQKYLELKISNIEWHESLKKYLFKLQPNESCPNLDKNGLCKIQRFHGESFLSNTCKTYPRMIQSINEKIFSRSLTLTCPVAADLILRQIEPIEFIESEDLPPILPNFSIKDVNDRQIENVMEIRRVSIRILQNRKVSIDQRFLTLGFFISQFGNINDNSNAIRHNIKMLDELCASEKFLREDLPRFCRAIKFNAEDFLRIMFTLLETMYGKDSDFKIRAEENR